MRLLDRLLALVLGVVLAGAAALAVAEIVAGLLGRGPLVVPRDAWHSTLGGLRWDDPALIAVVAGMILLGLVLLALQLVPRRPTELPLTATETAREAAVDRRGLQHRLHRVVTDDPDVVDARVRLRRRAKVRARVLAGSDRSAVGRRVTDAVQRQLDDLGLRRSPRVAVDTRRSRERVR